MRNILVFDDIEERLEKIAVAADLSVAEVVDEMLDAYLSDDDLIKHLLS